ncbi:UNVERIFIED_CONTAM: hypothetical protein PYX00_010133 [Menopon gallinae]|uniref:Uncharacterized protein n=1 Tax=Menopon gallinae TaxID=328185 RepID=A0AAW2HE71_9NEOP
MASIQNAAVGRVQPAIKGRQASQTSLRKKCRPPVMEWKSKCSEDKTWIFATPEDTKSTAGQVLKSLSLLTTRRLPIPRVTF